MAELEIRANKRFKIMEDVGARKDALERHAVRMVLRNTADPNAPMIPSPNSAHFRMHCYECGEVFWGVGGAMFCVTCLAAQAVEQELNYELAKIERETNMIEAKARLVKLQQRKKAQATKDEKTTPLRLST